MKLIKDFKTYEILDLNDGKKLENWNGIILSRPDPQVIWKKEDDISWKNVHATYNRSNKGGGSWEINKDIPASWTIPYKNLKFNLKLMGFKHTGLFPEQAYNWNIIEEKIKNANREVKVLNLFAYTGAASVVALASGASVTHVDSSKGMIEWAKENVNINNLSDKPIRFLVDDCLKFVKREIRRGNKYDIILMDPPSFGRGSSKEVWSLENSLYELVKDATELLSDKPIMFLINSYTTGLSMNVLVDILKLTVNKKYPGFITCDELGIPVKTSDLVLPCGIFARWESEEFKN